MGEIAVGMLVGALIIIIGAAFGFNPGSVALGVIIGSLILIILDGFKILRQNR